MPEALSSRETLKVFHAAAESAAHPDPTRRPHPSPADWRDHPIYFLLVDRFNRPDQPPREAWDRPTHGFQGGTFDGIREQLTYIKSLGCGAIWISPVQKNLASQGFSYHGYGIHDYLAIEPRFASDPARARLDPAIAEDELRALVDAAHGHGLHVILDVVINHVGNVFGYDTGAASEENSTRPYKWNGEPYAAFWRDENGVGLPPANRIHVPAGPSRDAAIWPVELQRSEYFRRRGIHEDSHPRTGDFRASKELATDYLDPASGRYPVQDALIRCHQYMIARFDLDGFRIDALKHVEPEFARVFASAIREYALSIGKRNFFLFGEVADGDEAILAQFVGRDTRGGAGEGIGVDAVLDFPLRGFLRSYAKAEKRCPAELVAMYRRRKREQRPLVASHGEASQFFVTFLDNHDDHGYRFTPKSPDGDDTFDPQFSLGFGCLTALQGIPCLYYGTEQGLTGLGDGSGDLGVREALWGMPNAFDTSSRFYRELQALLALRAQEPALRYGRQYFRPISGDGRRFGISGLPDGVLAFSRLLADREILVVANPGTDAGAAAQVHVVVDATLNHPGEAYRILYSNRPDPAAPGRVDVIQGAGVEVTDEDGGVHEGGPISAVRVQLRPMEIQILSR